MGDFSELGERATAQFGLLTAAQLITAGYSKRMISTRVRDGLFVRRGKGVLQLAGVETSWEQDLMAAVLTCQPGAAASHRSAARLWGMRTVDREVEVSIRFPRDRRVNDVTVHRSRDLELHDISTVDGFPVTTPERTICDLGLIFPEHEVARILRHAIAEGLVNRRQLWAMRTRTSKQGRNGTGVLERVLSAIPQGAEQTESGLEVLFLELCKRSSLPPPTLQLPVRVRGRHFRLDFAWPAERVFVEVDGIEFHSTPQQVAKDRQRQNLLVLAGWTPLRFTYADLKEPVSYTHLTLPTKA